MAKKDVMIKDAPLVDALSGEEKIPISDGSGEPRSTNINGIKDFIGDSYELTELSAEVGKKVEKGSLATINGQNIENGGNIVIEGGSAITPDWNASKNEDGFIKNKPYEIFKSRIEKVDDNTLRVSMAEDEYSGDYSVTGHYIKWSDSLYKLQYDETNLEINGGRDILYVTYDDGYYYLTHSRYDADYILSEFVDYPDSNSIFYVVKGIDATCLKDNVVKTLPQELSNDAKSQALANLGLTDIARKSELTELSAEKEDKANKATTLSSASTDTQYPSAKAVYDLVQDSIFNALNADYYGEE